MPEDTTAPSLSARPFRLSRLVLPVLLAAIALLTLLAPEEKALGQGIRVVYLHVSLIWAGLFGFTLNGLLGALVLISPYPQRQRWAQVIGWVALAFLTVGFLLSLAAAQVNWGAIFLAEPRVAAALRGLAVALLVQVGNGWLPWPRVGALLRVILAVFLAWTMVITPLIAHPQNPIRSSPSLALQGSFYGLFVLWCLVEATIVWYSLYRRNG